MNKNNTAGRSKGSLTATLAAGMALAFNQQKGGPGWNPQSEPVQHVHPVRRAEREAPPARPRRRKRVVKRDRGR